MNETGIMVGFKPDSDEEPAHFFIADEHHQVCCTPVSTFDALNPEELPHMAAFCWAKLTGEAECPKHVAYAVASAWLACFHKQQQDAATPQTLH
jgi:hypothetical protein